MNGDRIPKAIESLRAAIRALKRLNSADPRRTIPQLATALDCTGHARDLLALEYEGTVDHLHSAVLRARERSPGRETS